MLKFKYEKWSCFNIVLRIKVNKVNKNFLNIKPNKHI